MSSLALWLRALAALLVFSTASQSAYITTLLFAGGTPFQVTPDGAGGFLGSVVAAGTIVRFWANGSVVVALSGLSGPYGGAAPDAVGGFYAADTGNGVVRRVAAGGSSVAVPGYSGSSFGLCVDGAGGVFIGDTFANNGEFVALSSTEVCGAAPATPPPLVLLCS